ncbi:MAG TPA: orotidine-5'-phosphate decarboxylase [Acidimicrobiales bacterium]|nr:orotidine-5'-phosphate decarboxylase [Acidimicrobiales bacterium]
MADIRDSLAVALDVDDLVVAKRLAKQLRPYFGVAKVGLELYSAAGPDVVPAFAELGYRVFLDLKFHDIPTTVGRAARVIGALGAQFLNMHAAGGVDMLRAGVDGLAAGAAAAGLTPPTALGVTILTSEVNAPRDLMVERIETTLKAGCGGVVCAASDVATVKAIGPDLFAMVPGVRMEGDPLNDQGRPATPAAALAAGADVVILGRSVTAAADPVEAAARLMESLEPAR